MWNLHFTLVFLVLVTSNVSGKQKPKSVTTFIEAKWPAAPLLLEASEYIAEENPEGFWVFVDALCQEKYDKFHLLSEKDQYEIILLEAQGYLTPSQVSLMKFALSLHIHSPRVEMFAQIAFDRILPSECVAVADVGGQLTCNVNEVGGLLSNVEKDNKIELFDLDHKYPSAEADEDGRVVVVLYGQLGTPELRAFHSALKELASAGSVQYVLRHYIKERSGRRVRLSGYGVELQIKSTEYKVQDDTKVKSKGMGGSEEGDEEEEEDDEVEGFNFHRLKVLYPDKLENLSRLHQHLLDSTSDLAPLKAWQLQELSLQAAERIMSSPHEEALKVLTHIAQNFPLQARSLVRTVVQQELRQEVKLNQAAFASTLNLQPMDTALFLNGMFFDVDIADIMTIFEALRQELRTMEGLHKIGIKGKQMTPLMALDLSQSGVQDYAIDIRDSAVTYVNDIEKDKQYRRWPESLTELLRPTFPGMLRSIRRNLYNLVIIVDPSDEKSRVLLKMAESFVVHSAPLRVGVVLAVGGLKMLPSSETGKTNAGLALLEAFNYVSEEKDGQHLQGLSFITDVYAAAEDREITPEQVAELLKAKYPSADLEDIFGEDSDYDIGRRLANDFVQRSGFRRLPQVLLNGIPLDEKSLVADEFEEAVLSEIMSQTPMFQKAVYSGELKDNPLDYAMNQPYVMPRLNERVLQGKGVTNLNLMAGNPFSEAGKDSWQWFLSHGSQSSPQDLTAAFVYRAKYTMRRDDGAAKMISNWVVGDLESPEGRQLLSDALEQMRSSKAIRVTPVLNPSSLPSNSEPWDKDKFLFSRTVTAALKVMRPEVSNQYLSKILNEEVAMDISLGRKSPTDFPIQGFDMSLLMEAIEEDDGEAMLRAHRAFCYQSLGFKSGGERAVVSNGRVLGPLDVDEIFGVDDFGLLERYAFSTYADKVTKALAKVREEDDDADGMDLAESGDRLMRLLSLLMSRPHSKSRFEIPSHGDKYSLIKLDAPNPDQPAFDLVVIVDPVSRGAQKIGPILSSLLEVVNCNVRVFLNPVEKNSEMPLKSFYRYVLESEPQFIADGKLAPGPMARFVNMPTSVLLTQNMNVPENWLVEAVRSPYDLDNIRLDDVESTVHSEFELEYLLLEGHCFEQTMGNPPRGLQITLGTNHQPVVVDTIVMANLGYFQLKANPGAWLLRLRAGRSADIFDIVSVDGTEVSQNSSGSKILISSFRSHVIKLKVAKKPDMLHADLLADEESNPGIWNSITSTFGGGNEDGIDSQSSDSAQERINIFSLASGHLYERFIRIMMLSVIKHTNTPVKFWFLKNYLSPTFKDSLPHMAERYKFEYELVQYKWPRWLHQQTEKQRIIWGYKILFLDVLFPLSIKKIIFVDADQVVRADMKELHDMDLGGAPYGYTPFCGSRKEMDGFRFWNQGYWKNHLQGRSYHISALYVVDLKRFRRIAAGDRLRGQYQALSQDPNSLSNLDQDLPNNMIHQVAIKSLPQEWLWCETWCDNQSKKYAKTIDLCNNPLTKEAKLTAAMRIVAEWKEYDEEIKHVLESVGAEEDAHHVVHGGQHHGSAAHSEL
ncbi:UDP-glucose:glycoprotein glucosyltransferase 1 isoform X2 [Ischnura elegans]|uniref:UDP-glucose:glycoprotein glucosyltransferase 1 isoform X2 n=1 Tax=Ischnura elegans TaxID=197161 RepID=UPI001ED8838E|nr:UDP-glucose:glycoprotein glucosyltransferase 1 isoform X2 [Ischnura elegans]